MAVPTLLELMVQGSSVALRYSEALNPVLPSINRFQVMVNGRRVYASGSASLSADGTTIRFTLAKPIAAGASVTVTYINVNGRDKRGYGDIKSLATSERAVFQRQVAATNLTGQARPTLLITSDKRFLKAGESATITFSFSRGPGSSFTWDGTRGDITVSGGTLSALVATADPKVFTATFTPTASGTGTASITVGAGTYSDAFGTSGGAGSSPSLAYDTLPPSLTSSSIPTEGALLVRSTRAFTLTFSEPVALGGPAHTVFRLFDGGGRAIPFSEAVPRAGGREVALTLAEAPPTGIYRLDIQGDQIRDAAGNTLVPGSLGLSFTISPYDDILIGTAASEVLETGAGNDLIEGRGGSDLLRGGAGEDRLLGGDGFERIFGGDGDDVLDVGGGGGMADGEAGNDHLIGGGIYAILSGGAGDDLLEMTAGDGQAFGDSGNDTLIGGRGYDRLSGGSGNDFCDVGAGGGSAEGDGGDDTLSTILEEGDNAVDLRFDGGKGNDRLSVSGHHSGSVVLLGGGGLDALTGSAGHDVLADADDTFEEARFNPLNGHWYRLLRTYATWQNALTTAAATRLSNRQGYLATITSAEEQAFLTETFKDEYAWIGASDALEEGTWRWVDGPEAGRVFYIQGQAVQPGYSIWNEGEPDDWEGQDAARLSSWSNSWSDISQSEYAYILLEFGGMPGDGAEPVRQAGDTLQAGDGDDRIESAGDNDHIDGGAGNDELRLNLSLVTEDILLSLADPSQPQNLPGGGVVKNVEALQLIAGSGNDTIVGGTGSNLVYAGAGDDVLDAGTGGGRLFGQAGNDQLRAMQAAAELQGGEGDDVLELGPQGGTADGGAGNDQLLGGSGAADMLSGGDGNDHLDVGVGGGFAFGAAGDDVVLAQAVESEGADPAAIVLNGGMGNDRLSVAGRSRGTVRLEGGGGVDFLSGSDGNDELIDGDDVYERAFLNPLNGHWYKLLRSAMTWGEAQAIAAASRLSDRQGYLVTITSAEEQRFLEQTFGDQDAWIGASDAQEEGTWRWMDGPEAGSIFYVKGLDNQPGYSNWNPGTLYSRGEEDFAAWIYSTDWYDSYSSARRDVLIEYGGTAGDGTGPVAEEGDTLLGGDGDDTIRSLNGTDRIDGGAGNDTLDLSLAWITAGVTLSLADPSLVQMLPGGGSVVNVEALLLISGSGHDSIVGGSGACQLVGGDGDDALVLGSGGGGASGGAGNDRLRGGTGRVWLDGGDGNDVIEAGADGADAAGGNGDDSLLGGSGYEWLSGGEGDDSLDVASGGGYANGDAGNDHLLGGSGQVWLVGGDGNDRLDLGSATGQAYGEEGADVLWAMLEEGTASASITLDGGSGNDQLSVSGQHTGTVNLFGGGGLDALTGSDGNDALNDGDDIFEDPQFNAGNGHWYRLLPTGMTWWDAQRTAAATRLSGRQGYLVSITSPEEQAFLAATFGGQTTWIGAADLNTDGTWRWLGGPEAGTVFYKPGLDSQPGYSNWGPGEPDEQLVRWGNVAPWTSGGPWGVYTKASSAIKVLMEFGGTPGDGTDPVVVAGDTLIGGDGEDTLTSRGGTDHLDGGPGNDQLLLDLSRTTKAITLSIADPSLPQALPDGGSVVNVEQLRVFSGSGNDSIVGGNGFDGLHGGAGDDVLDLGSGGGDASGVEGNDTLLGGDGVDALYGGDGDDLIDGGLRHDVLYGNSGADVFRFSTAPDPLADPDILADFSVGEGDQIHLLSAAFPGLGPLGWLADNRLHLGANATDAEQRILYDPLSGSLLFDPDGEAGLAARPFATLPAALPLTAHQFRVV